MRPLDTGRGAATVRLRQEQVDGLRLIVETEGSTEGALIREAVDLLLAERSYQPPEPVPPRLIRG